MHYSGDTKGDMRAIVHELFYRALFEKSDYNVVCKLALTSSF